YGDGVGALAACAPPPVSPEHVALGRVLHEEDVVVAGTGQGDVPERGRVPEAAADVGGAVGVRSEEHTSELQSRENLVCRLLLESSGASPRLPSFPTRRSSDLYGDGVGALAACAPPPVSPEHVALGRVLHEEDVVVAGTGQGDVPERGRVPEAAADVGGAVGV